MDHRNAEISEAAFAAIERRFVAARTLKDALSAVREHDRRNAAVGERLHAVLKNAMAEFEAAGAECRKEGMPC